MRQIAREVQNGELSPDAIDEQTISDRLYTAGMPDPDLLIRTAGEMRVSNYLLWQISYAELVVTPMLAVSLRSWPSRLNTGTNRITLWSSASGNTFFSSISRRARKPASPN